MHSELTTGNFLGNASDKVCSGSDDGNFFVWDKASGALEGVWEGGTDVVNVVEQHPTLPVLAVAGIDNTPKIFAPVQTPVNPSFIRTQLAARIVARNALRPHQPGIDSTALQFLSHILRSRPTSSAQDRISLMNFLRSTGAPIRMPEDDEDWGSP